jgi:hypothetical protein
VYHSGVRSRGAAVVLIAALLGPGLSAFQGDPAHGCTAHVCQCRSPHPATPASVATEAVPPCHKAQAAHRPTPLPDCAIRGVCQHDAPQLASSAPFTLATPIVVMTLVASGEPRLPAPHAVLAGFDRLDPRPPRASS